MVRKKRENLGLTQKEFAKRIGKTTSDIKNYENDRAIPPGDVMLKIQELPESK